jgi:hypothetical protein
MATDLTRAGGLLNNIQGEYGPGWDTNSELELALRFIDSFGDDGLIRWTDFLIDQADSEDEDDQ